MAVGANVPYRLVIHPITTSIIISNLVIYTTDPHLISVTSPTPLKSTTTPHFNTGFLVKVHPRTN